MELLDLDAVLLERTLDAAEVGVYWIDLETRRAILSSGLARILKAGDEAFEGSLDDLRERFWAPGGTLAEETVDARYLEGGRGSFDLSWLRADGIPIWVHVDTTSRETNGHREVAGVVHDVTERKLRELELARASAHLRRAHELARLGTYEIDLAARVITLAPELAAMFGLPAEETVLSLDDYRRRFYHPDDLADAVAGADYAYAVHGHFQMQGRIIRADGTPIWVHACTTVDRSNGSPRAFGVFQDITETRHLQDQLRQAEKSEALGELAASIAHDFNNLLLIAGSYSDLALKHRDSARFLDDLAHVKSAVDDGKELVKHLLAFSRSESEHPVRIDLNDLVSAFTSGLARFLGPKITISATLAAEPLPVVLDPRELDRALLNLALNARDAMPQGGTLRLDTSYDKDTNEALITVTDTGTGIPDDILPHIFEPFFTTKAEGKGTGLGLASARRITEAANGTITASSQPNTGTRFELRLPRRNTPEQPATP